MSVSKESSCNAGDLGSIPGSVRSPGEGNGKPPYSCLENPMDRGAWQATVHGVTRDGHNLVTKPPPPGVQELHIHTQMTVQEVRVSGKSHMSSREISYT